MEFELLLFYANEIAAFNLDQLQDNRQEWLKKLQKFPLHQRTTVCQRPGTNLNGLDHGLRTANEGINQRYLKNWADVADKICFGHT